MVFFRNLKELERRFQTQQDCLVYYEAIRWADGVFCPHCEGEKFYKLKKDFQYRCANTECKKTFNVLHKTIFENTKIPLSTWFTAIYLATSHKKGISSHQLARDLGITQRSAWFVLHRIREMLREKEPVKSARGAFHTNTIEGFFKRGIVGISNQTSPKHIHRYCNEFSYRYNTRGLKENERFIHALKQSDRPLLYKELISN